MLIQETYHIKEPIISCKELYEEYYRYMELSIKYNVEPIPIKDSKWQEELEELLFLESLK